MFSAVATLMFGDVPQFATNSDTFVYFFQSSLGNMDFTQFDTDGITSPVSIYTERVGYIYYSIFLLSNMVLLLNFVIAILSSTFARFEEIKLGLYYNVINRLFPIMEYCPYFGALTCTRPPLPVYILTLPFLPFYWLFGNQINKERLASVNALICAMLYLPISLFLTCFFTFANIIMTPIAFLVNSVRIIGTILISRSL
jgi:hypothetical protein